jgi:hypothetical protein
MFTKMFYQLIADTIKVSPTLSDFVEKIIEVFKRDNSLFDEERFRKACRRIK